MPTETPEVSALAAVATTAAAPPEMRRKLQGCLAGQSASSRRAIVETDDDACGAARPWTRIRQSLPITCRSLLSLMGFILDFYTNARKTTGLRSPIGTDLRLFSTGWPVSASGRPRRGSSASPPAPESKSQTAASRSPLKPVEARPTRASPPPPATAGGPGADQARVVEGEPGQTCRTRLPGRTLRVGGRHRDHDVAGSSSHAHLSAMPTTNFGY
jgi:hypothetical protein